MHARTHAFMYVVSEKEIQTVLPNAERVIVARRREGRDDALCSSVSIRNARNPRGDPLGNNTAQVVNMASNSVRETRADNSPEHNGNTPPSPWTPQFRLLRARAARWESPFTERAVQTLWKVSRSPFDGWKACGKRSSRFFLTREILFRRNQISMAVTRSGLPETGALESPPGVSCSTI